MVFVVELMMCMCCTCMYGVQYVDVVLSFKFVVRIKRVVENTTWILLCADFWGLLCVLVYVLQTSVSK